MDAARNQGLLLAACKANGIAVSADTPPDIMQARLLGHRVRKRDREIASNPVRDDAPHNKTTFLHMEVERIGKDIGGVTARNRAQLEAEAESRWQMLKTRNIQENDVFVTDITSEVSEQFTSNGWVAVLEEPEGTYFRKTKSKAPAKSDESEPKESKKSDADIIEEQETAYAIAQVEDHVREEKRQKQTGPAEAATGESIQGAAIQGDDKAANITAAPIDMNLVRRRCMDWLIINNKSDALAQMSGIVEFISKNAIFDEIGDIDVYINRPGAVNVWDEHTRVLASKISYAMYPPETDLGPMAVDAKKSAATPSSLWTSNEIKAMFAKELSDSRRLYAAMKGDSEVPVPEVSLPEVPVSEVPVPEVSLPEVPVSEVPKAEAGEASDFKQPTEDADLAVADAVVAHDAPVESIPAEAE